MGEVKIDMSLKLRSDEAYAPRKRSGFVRIAAFSAFIVLAVFVVFSIVSSNIKINEYQQQYDDLVEQTAAVEDSNDELQRYLDEDADLDEYIENMARDKPLVGRVTYANGDAQEFTDAEAFLKCIRDELPYCPTTGLRYEVLTDDPSVRKQVDDMIFDFYGEEAPCRQEDHEPRPEQGMTFGGM